MTSLLCGCAMSPQKQVHIDPAQDLQSEIDKAGNHQRLVLPARTYTLSQPLVIRAKSDLTLDLRSGAKLVGSNWDLAVLEIGNSDQITVLGGYFGHLMPQGRTCYAPVVRIWGSQNVRFDGCELFGCGEYGISAAKTRDLQIASCFVHHNSGAAFDLRSCDNVRIKGCRLADNTQIIIKEDVRNLDFERSEVMKVTEKETIAHCVAGSIPIRIIERRFEGKLHGVQRGWFQDGSLYHEQWYVHGMLHGDGVFYSRKGELLATQKWENGFLQSSSELINGKMTETVVDGNGWCTYLDCDGVDQGGALYHNGKYVRGVH